MKRSAYATVIWLLVGCAGIVRAEDVPLWGRWEHALIARSSAAPETDLTMQLVSPTGKTFAAAAFWDGGTVWRVRFMPTEVGQWRFKTHSTPSVEGLDGRSGEFFCRPASTAVTPFQRHGPIHVSANGRFFEHADGTPFFWVGDTVWYGAILSSREDWETYLADRAAKHFDVVHFNVVAPRNGVSADENGRISFLNRHLIEPPSLFKRAQRKALRYLGLYEQEPIRMDPRFYQRLDERVSAVNAHGLLAGIVLMWGLRPEDSGNLLPESEVVRAMRYLVARYGAHQVVWILTGDAAYNGASGERWKRIGRAVFGGSQVHAPVTTHPLGMDWPWDAFRDEQWLDFLVYQSGHGDDANALRWIHSGPPHEHWQDSPARPLINIEPPYEGHIGLQSRIPHSDYSTRRAIYWSLLNAPTAGVTYGAHGVWSWHTAVGQPPTDHPRMGVAKTWREALSFPGSTQMMHLQGLFTSIDWWRLQPDDHLVVEQPSPGDPGKRVSASRSPEADLAVVYLPAGGEIKLRTSALRADLAAEWFDPRTGRRTPVQPAHASDFAAPDGQDWVLLLHSVGQSPTAAARIRPAR